MSTQKDLLRISLKIEAGAFIALGTLQLPNADLLIPGTPQVWIDLMEIYTQFSLFRNGPPRRPAIEVEKMMLIAGMADQPSLRSIPDETFEQISRGIEQKLGELS